MILSLNNRHTTLNEKIARIGFLTFCVSAMFSDLISTIIGNSVMYLLYFFAIGSMLFSVLKGDRIILKKSVIKILAPWLIFILIFLFLHSELLRHRSFFTTIRWSYYFSMIIVLTMCPKKWYMGFLKILGSLTLINVFFVFFFLVFSSKYRIMKSLWGFWPTGTQSGAAGYRAGIASHYSENAMILAVGMVVFASIFIAFWGEIKKSKSAGYIILAFTSLICILLTAKRAHLLFGFMAILFGYFIYKPEMRKKNFFRIAVFAVFAVTLFGVVAAFVPSVNYIYERFVTAGEDQESQTRFEMWSLAISNFLRHPLFGIGWGGFKYKFNEFLYNPAQRDERYAFLNAHNVYIQMLCECGIVGITLFFGNAVRIFVKTTELFKRKFIRYTPEYAIAVFSIAMQTFFYLYCFTGNCLYDMMFSFQSIAIGFSIGLYTQRKLS